MAKQIKIHIEEDGILYKVTSIYLLSDGSLKMDVPYCPYDEGIVIKHPIDYSKREFLLGLKDCVQKFKAKNRPQLSIHASGFVQFSGKGIISGIDSFGKAKGVGIYSYPLDTPIKSGPTFGGTFWGINHYEKTTSVSPDDIVLKQSDFIRKIPRNMTSEEALNLKFNAYIIEFFIFPKQLLNFISKTDRGEKMTFRFWNYYECPGAIFTFPVIRLLNHSSFIGVLPSLISSDFPDKFGFSVGSPSGPNSPGEEAPPLYMLRFSFPAHTLSEEMEYLDFLDIK